MESEQGLHAGVDEEGVVEGIETAADAGLVGQHKELIAEGAGVLESVTHAGDDFHAGGIGQVVFVEDQRAVAIEEESTTRVGVLGFVFFGFHGLTVTDVSLELGGGDGGGTEFADDDAGGGVREVGGGFEFGAGGKGQDKGSEGGVAGAGDIVNFAGGGRDGFENFAGGAEQHAVFAEGDDQVFRREFFVEAGADGGGGEGRTGCGVESGEFEGFAFVGGDEVEAVKG